MLRRKKRHGIADVARMADVSITTVSRVINNVSTVTPANRARVQGAVAALKYQPDVSAQRLARGTNNTVGLVMPSYPGIFYSFYAIELIRGVGHACEVLRLDLIFHITGSYSQFNATSAGGIIFADILENRTQVEAALSAGVPCVVINNIVKGIKVDYIGVDNFTGGNLAADYLVSLGHKRVATITGNLQTQAGIQRLKGFKEVLKNNKIKIHNDYIVEGDYSRRSARIAMEELLSLAKPPTAIFAASDDMALEIINVAMEKGLHVPGEISVIGFDDNPDCLYGPVALTTIKQPLFDMAVQAVEHLSAAALEKKRHPLQKILKPQLIVRDSCSTCAS